MRLCCEVCDNVAASTCKDWMDHLLSDVHQNNTQKSLFQWPEERNTRSLVVTARPNIKGEFLELGATFFATTWYFSKYGIISDAFSHPGRKFYIIQLEKREYARKAMAFDPCLLEGFQIVLRYKSDLTPEDWFKLSSCSSLSSMVENEVEYIDTDTAKQMCVLKHMWLTKETKNFDPDVQLQKFIAVCTMSESDFSTREEIRSIICFIIKQKYPQAKIFGFGDVITGLGDPNSIFQMCLNLSGTIQQEAVRQDTDIKAVIEDVYNLIVNINRSSDSFRDLMVTRGIDMPYINFTHDPTNIRVELHFDSVRSVQSSRLVQFMVSLDERVLPLILMIRYWAECNIRPYNSISNHMLEMLIIVFLNARKILPNVAFLQSKCNPQIPLVDGLWNVNFCSDLQLISEILSQSGRAPVHQSALTGKSSAISMIILANEFFKYYASVDLESNVVCSMLGNCMPKSAFDADNNDVTLPDLLQPYKEWALLQNGEDRLQIGDPFCIQDPFYLGKNLASNVSTEALKSFQHNCCMSMVRIEQLINTEGCVPNFLDFVGMGTMPVLKGNNCNNASTPAVLIPVPSPEPKITRTFLGKRPSSQSMPTSAVNPFIESGYSEDDVKCQQVGDFNERFPSTRRVTNTNEFLPPTHNNSGNNSGANRVSNQPLSKFEEPERILRDAGPIRSQDVRVKPGNTRGNGNMQGLMSLKISVHQPNETSNSQGSSLSSRLTMLASSSVSRTIVRNTETGTSFGSPMVRNVTVTSPHLEDNQSELGFQVHRVARFPDSRNSISNASALSSRGKKRGKRSRGKKNKSR